MTAKKSTAKGTKAQTDAAKLAEAVKRHTAAEYAIDYETLTLEVTHRGETLALPLTLTLDQSDKLSAIVDADSDAAFLDYLADIGHGQAADTLRGWTTATLAAVISHWWQDLQAVQEAALGE